MNEAVNGGAGPRAARARAFRRNVAAWLAAPWLAATAATAAPPAEAPASTATAPAASEAPASTALWEQCASQLGAPASAPPRARRIGETPAAAARILPRILSGEKTVTATTPWVYERDPSQRPVAGGLSMLLDGDGRPVAILRTTHVKTVAFEAVTADDTRYEGEPVRPLEAWRDVHRRYFDRVLQPLGREWSPAMPVTLERFEVACAARRSAPSDRAGAP